MALKQEMCLSVLWLFNCNTEYHDKIVLHYEEGIKLCHIAKAKGIRISVN